MKKLSVLLTFSLISTIIFAQEILPLPTQPGKYTQPTKIEQKTPSNKSIKEIKDTETLLPLPKQIKSRNKGKAPTAKKSTTKPAQSTQPTETILPVLPTQTQKQENIPDDFPVIPDEMIIQSHTPSPTPTALSKQESANLDAILSTQPALDTSDFQLFPKDTSSAIFMIMKTWFCEDQDGNELLAHAIESYGEEASDYFHIEGLSPELPFIVSLYEEDITFDELLDILGSKTSRDWGVDMYNRVVYFYPPGMDFSSDW